MNETLIETLIESWILINIATLFLLTLVSVNGDANFSFVNPVVIYDKIKVNWFGAWLLAVVCNICLPAIAIPYWIYKVCTVGR